MTSALSLIDGPHELALFSAKRIPPGTSVIAISRRGVEEINDLEAAIRGRLYYTIKRSTEPWDVGPKDFDTHTYGDKVTVEVRIQLQVFNPTTFYSQGQHDGLQLLAEGRVIDEIQQACRSNEWNQTTYIADRLRTARFDITPGMQCEIVTVEVRPSNETHQRHYRQQIASDQIEQMRASHSVEVEAIDLRGDLDGARARVQRINSRMMHEWDHNDTMVAIARESEMNAARDSDRYERIMVEAQRFGLAQLDPLLLRALSLQSSPSNADMLGFRAILSSERRDRIEIIKDLMQTLVSSGMMTTDHFSVMSKIIETEVQTIAPELLAVMGGPRSGAAGMVAPADLFDDDDDFDFDEGIEDQEVASVGDLDDS